MTCPGVALATTLPPRLRGWPSCVLMPVPPCICRSVSDPRPPEEPLPSRTRRAHVAIAARSMVRPASMMISTALTVAANPHSAAATRMSSSRSARTRPPMRSSRDRMVSGKSFLIGLSPHMRGLRAMIASRLAGSTWVLAEWPQILSSVVIVSPSGPRSSISKTRTPACKRIERHLGPAGYRFASMTTEPVLSAFTLLQSHGSNRTPGKGGMWSFSASNSSRTGTPCR